MTFDPQEHRAHARELWEAAAAGWEAADEFARITEPVSDAMVEAIAPEPGQRILELAAGRGDTGLKAAAAVGATGRLVSTDGAEAMVDAARRRAAALRIDNAEFKPMELEWIDAETASFDAVLCRFGYMHAVDPEAALRETRRVLRPDGRVALAVWDSPDANPWLNAPREELGAAAEGPGAFALAAEGQARELLLAAGMQDVETVVVPLRFDAPSLDSLWQLVIGISSTMAPLVRALSPAEHFALRDAVDARWAPFVGADGTVAVPGRALVLSASA